MNTFVLCMLRNTNGSSVGLFNIICCFPAIEAMRKAHKEEMDKTQKALQNGANVDIRQLRAQYKCV